MLNSKHKDKFNRWLKPAARVCIVFNLSPNQLTVLGFLFGILSCVIYLWTHNPILFAGLILFCALFDALDGAVARESGRATKFGAYFDALCDRLFEGFACLSVAYVTGHWVGVMFFLLGSLVVSYAKARAAMEVSISNLEWPDLMEKAERGILFLVGFLASEMTHIQIAGHDLFFWTLIVVNSLIYLTIIQRVRRAKAYIEARS